jgi:hypothetical protein
MKREWVTLAFGILLVGGIAAVSVWQNLPFGRDAAAAPAVPVADSPQPSRGPLPASAARAAAADAPVAVVRLDATVAVVHKHRFGSCEGTLRAVPGSLTYTSTNRDDAFRLPMSDVDAFDLDDARKALRVKKRGGRTWNFEPRADNTTSLVAFHREVERARRPTR